MRLRTWGVALAVVPLLAGCGEDATPDALPTAPGPVFTSEAPIPGCTFQPQAPPVATSFKSRPPMTVERGEVYYATLRTSCGEIVWRMPVSPAPLTVNSFVTLARAQYFDGSFCHRMTNSPSLTVLQCGDDGAGGPGYLLPEENLPSAAAQRGDVTYPRGTVAVARTAEPGTGGSQFFLVIKDSPLPPNYTLFAKVVRGLDVLDRILSVGIAGGASDGAPARRIFIEEFTVSKTPPAAT